MPITRSRTVDTVAVLVAVLLVAALGVLIWRGVRTERRLTELSEEMAKLSARLDAAESRADRAERETESARREAAEARSDAELATRDATDARRRAELAGEQSRVALEERQEAMAARDEAERREAAALEREARALADATAAYEAATAAKEEAASARAESAELRRRREREISRLEKTLGEIAETRRTALGLVMNLGSSVEFDFDEAALRPENRELLARIAGVLLTAGDYSIQVFGHTDDVGSESYNLELSERRARAVADFLVESGLPPEVITSKGLGKSQPLVEGTDERARQRNRRVEIAVVSYEEEYVPTEPP